MQDRIRPFTNGKFVISLDFELYWGVRDVLSIDEYGNHILGVRKAIPAMLELFKRYDVRATFSTVGFLFARNKEQLIQSLPTVRPAYLNPDLSPYGGIARIGDDEQADPYHFGFSLLEQVKDNKQHEIGTHTFSHYYCLEPGQNLAAFMADLGAARGIAEASGIDVRSLVFPRNQFNEQYLEACREAGITSYRGNPSSWLYKARDGRSESSLRRALRLVDAYLNLSGFNCHTADYIRSSVIPDIAASRFLRPYNAGFAFAEPLRLRRITKAMKHAARTNTLFHLWWHPHNFGKDLDKNISFLQKILASYAALQNEHGFESVTMSGLADQLNKPNA